MNCWRPGTRPTGKGAPVRNPEGPNAGNCRPVEVLASLEGKPIHYNPSLDTVFVDVSASQWGRFDKNSGGPGDYPDSRRFDPAFLKNRQETYDDPVHAPPNRLQVH